ncbi:hypothetical protein LNV08_22750, partial [Paucibacter sp. TC2R-5]|uniref:hypothetical protein n=1 Tax=Paucibacter sp. TC2R-5 TaxID=2893555 RepID=UPI0021E4C96D
SPLVPINDFFNRIGTEQPCGSLPAIIKTYCKSTFSGPLVRLNMQKQLTRGSVLLALLCPKYKGKH